MGAAACVGGWFLVLPPSLVKFRAWVCKTAGPLEYEKNSPIRILRYQRPCVRFGHRGHIPSRPQKPPGRPQRPPPPGRFCLSYPLPGGRSGPQKLPRRPQGPPPPGRFCLPFPLPGGRSRPQEPPGRPQRPPPPGRSACPLPYQGAAAGPRSRQGNRRDLRRRGGYFQCQEGL